MRIEREGSIYHPFGDGLVDRAQHLGSVVGGNATPVHRTVPETGKQTGHERAANEDERLKSFGALVEPYRLRMEVGKHDPADTYFQPLRYRLLIAWIYAYQNAAVIVH